MPVHNKSNHPSANSRPKRTRTESRRLREGRENSQVLEKQHAERKATTEARRKHAREEEDDNLLVERENDSLEIAKLRAQNQHLLASNTLLRTTIRRQKKEANDDPSNNSIVLEFKGDASVKVIRHGIGLKGPQNYLLWRDLRTDCRVIMLAGGFNWDLSWTAQLWEAKLAVIQLCEDKHPRLKIYANHAATEFLLAEIFSNHQNYIRNKARKSGSHSSTPKPVPQLVVSAPPEPLLTNDGDTELDEFSDDEEVGVSDGMEAQAVPRPRSESPVISRLTTPPTTFEPLNLSRPDVIKKRPRPVIFLSKAKRGRLLAQGRGRGADSRGMPGTSSRPSDDFDAMTPLSSDQTGSSLDD